MLDLPAVAPRSQDYAAKPAGHVSRAARLVGMTRYVIQGVRGEETINQVFQGTILVFYLDDRDDGTVDPFSANGAVAAADGIFAIAPS